MSFGSNHSSSPMGQWVKALLTQAPAGTGRCKASSAERCCPDCTGACAATPGTRRTRSSTGRRKSRRSSPRRRRTRRKSTRTWRSQWCLGRESRRRLLISRDYISLGKKRTSQRGHTSIGFFFVFCCFFFGFSKVWARVAARRVQSRARAREPSEKSGVVWREKRAPNPLPSLPPHQPLPAGACVSPIKNAVHSLPRMLNFLRSACRLDMP